MEGDVFVDFDISSLAGQILDRNPSEVSVVLVPQSGLVGPDGKPLPVPPLDASCGSGSSSRGLHFAMKLAAAHQAAGNIGGLQMCARSREMRGQISCNGDQDMSTLVAGTPFAKLLHTRFKHLVGVKTGVFPQQRMCERRDQRLGRVTQDEMESNKACGHIDLLLAIEGIEQSSADLLDRNRQIVEPVTTLARQRSGRHIQVTREIKCHCAVQ